MGLTISTLSPSFSCVSAYCVFGLIPRLSATAVFSHFTLRCSSRPSTLRPSGSSTPLPLTLTIIKKPHLNGCGRKTLGSRESLSLRWNYPEQVRGVPGRTRFSGNLPQRPHPHYTPASSWVTRAVGSVTGSRQTLRRHT